MSGALSPSDAADRQRGADPGAATWLKFERMLGPPCVALALAGGLVLLSFMLMSVGSILSRVILGSPLLGDYELVERGCAITVFAVLPYCHLKGGNVIVDMFVGFMPNALRRALAFFAELIFAVVAALLTWRLAVGGLQLRSYLDMSMMLQIPTWWVFIPIVLSTALLTLVCLARASSVFAKEHV